LRFWRNRTRSSSCTDGVFVVCDDEIPKLGIFLNADWSAPPRPDAGLCFPFEPPEVRSPVGTFRKRDLLSPRISASKDGGTADAGAIGAADEPDETLFVSDGNDGMRAEIEDDDGGGGGGGGGIDETLGDATY
jgi:hypothetical protein